MARASALFALILVACGDPSPMDDAAVDASLDAGSAFDADLPIDAASPVDAGPGAGARDASEDAGPTDCAEPPPAPMSPLRPVPGELFYAQIGLGGFSLGESALVVGPDGTVVLIDVGNDSHRRAVVDALMEMTGSLDVDHIVVTHFHADHGDGVEDVLGDVRWTGTLVHRGFTDFTEAANGTTLERVCRAARSRPGADAALCGTTEGPCDASSAAASAPAGSCPGLALHDLELGAGAVLDFFAANGFIAGASYERDVGPLQTVDTNGENARSVVGLLEHGAFRLLITGDLTGGGSDTDDVESFFVPRLEAAAGIGERGVDVLHAAHHGRDTSSNAAWTDRLLPADGRSRNVVMGVSTAHVGSPHREVLDTVTGGGRLAQGAAWTTRVALGGDRVGELVDADGGSVLISTRESGRAYVVQAVDEDGVVVSSRSYRSVAACP